MANYQPPSENLATFNPYVFSQNDEPLTIEEGTKYFLRYPIAQGAETLSNTTINGVLTANSTSEFKRPLSMSDTTSSTNRTINSSFFNFYNSSVASPLTSNGSLFNNNGSMTLQNTTNAGTINFVLNDAGGVQNTPLQLTNTAITLDKSTTITGNNSLQMNAGVGRINQSGTTNDTSTTNNLKKTTIQYNNSGNTSAIPALEIFESNGRGAYFVPNTQSGNYGPNVATNDFAIISRFFNMPTTALCFATGTGLRNHLRLSSMTDLSGCSLILQNGGSNIANASEFRMDYNSIGHLNTISFNNPINFNPTNNGAISSIRRQLIGLGTLSFTDISGGNSTNGVITSAIWTDSSLVSGVGRGMILDCGINGGDIIFRTNDANGVKSTSLALNGDLNTTYNRLYQEIQPTWSNVNGFYELSKDSHPTLNPRSSGVNSVGTWTTRTSLDLQYYSVCWSPELLIFVAVSSSGSGGTGIDRVATSPDGITWTARDCFAQSWRNVIWVSELGLFVANSVIGAVNQRVMTSPDGINWTLRTTPSDNSWRQFAWSPELSLLVCVSDTGGTDRVMTSPDGITWTARTTPNNNGWNGVAWSAELGLFAAVSNTGSGNRVMTSPDGINWTARSSPADNSWRSVVWASEIGIFVAVSADGNLNRVMTSHNGVNWTIRTTNNNNWQSVCWSPELKLFVAIASSGSADRVMTSPNGINWTLRTTNNNDWIGICWSPELGIFVGSSITGSLRFMTSSLAGRPPTSFNVFDSGSNIISESGDWTLQANIIYATQLDIRRSYGTPLSRLEIVNDGSNSTYIKARAPSGQATMFFNTYNGASDDDVFNITSSRVQIRRPIGFNYLTTPSSSTQLGFVTSFNFTDNAVSSQAAASNIGNITSLGVGTWEIKVLLTFLGSGNHSLTKFEYGIGTATTSFTTTAPYNVTYMREQNISAGTTLFTRQISFTLQLTSATTIYFNHWLSWSGGGTVTIGGCCNYTRVG